MAVVEYSGIRNRNPSQMMAELRAAVERAKENLAAAMSVFNEAVEPDAIDRAIELINRAEAEYHAAVRRYQEATGVIAAGK